MSPVLPSMDQMTALRANVFGAAPPTCLPGSREGTDLALVRRCAGGDPAALREIVRRHQGALFGFLAQMLGSREDAEEALQDVFLRVWQQAGRFEGRSAFSTWLYRVAANVARDALRHRRSRVLPVPLTESSMSAAPDPQGLALEGLEREGNSGRLRQALGALRPDDRLVLVLYYMEEMSCREICAVTGHSSPVLKVRLLRARRRLRGVMEAMMPEEAE